MQNRLQPPQKGWDEPFWQEGGEPQPRVRWVSTRESYDPLVDCPTQLTLITHLWIFLFVSWVGGGNPPWADVKSLSLRCDQENQVMADLSSELVFYMYERDDIGEEMTKNGLKPTKIGAFFTLIISLANWGAASCNCISEEENCNCISERSLSTLAILINAISVDL